MTASSRILTLIDWSERLVPYAKALRFQETQADYCKKLLVGPTLILLQVTDETKMHASTAFTSIRYS